MRWDERQRAMLEAMGIRLWAPVPEADEPLGVGTGEAVSGSTSAAGLALTARKHIPEADRSSASPARGQPALPPAPDPGGAVRSRTPLFAANRDPGLAAGAGAGPGREAAIAGPAGTLPGPGETLDGAALAARAAVCTACALCAGRTHSVFGATAEAADWLVVGDAPDGEDDSAGEPFAGAAGRLLDNMLAAIEVSRGGSARERRAGVTHAVKCRPPGQRMPEASELERCSVYLQRQIDLVRPRVILAMGRFAAQALLGTSEPVARLRGRVHRLGAAAVVVTAAPAYLLRHPESKAEAWDDLCLALEAAGEAVA